MTNIKIPYLEIPDVNQITDKQLKISKKGMTLGQEFVKAQIADDSEEKRYIILKNALSKYKKSSSDYKHPISLKFKKLQEEHENYFNLKRVSGLLGDILIENVIDVYMRFLEDKGHGSSLSILEGETIYTALVSYVNHILTKAYEDKDEH